VPEWVEIELVLRRVNVHQILLGLFVEVFLLRLGVAAACVGNEMVSGLRSVSIDGFVS
jgi:hypothetical protein